MSPDQVKALWPYLAESERTELEQLLQDLAFETFERGASGWRGLLRVRDELAGEAVTIARAYTSSSAVTIGGSYVTICSPLAVIMPSSTRRPSSPRR